MPDFITGTTLLPDIGECSYNGCTFGPLFESNVSGHVEPDAANRTVKYVRYTLTLDGYVTLQDGVTDITSAMYALRLRLTQQGGVLTYDGRGLDLLVNAAAGVKGSSNDVMWGPVPKLLEFQPLGGGRSAKVKWQVETCIPEVPIGNRRFGLLQLNFDTSVSYTEDGYSSLAIRGVLEIPLTRRPSQTTRTLSSTVDDFRSYLEFRILEGVDLNRFRVTRRNFNVSRDKRTMEWDYEMEEKPYMDLPMNCSIARGTFSVKQSKAGLGNVRWLCNLRATYTVRADKPRREAWYAFLALLRVRMARSVFGLIDVPNGNVPPIPLQEAVNIARAVVDPGQGNRAVISAVAGLNTGNAQKATLYDFSFEEGLYLDSKTISFSCTWTLMTKLRNLLIASGLWAKVPEQDALGRNLWATSMRDVSKTRSWYGNQLNPSVDVIIDFGSRDI